MVEREHGGLRGLPFVLSITSCATTAGSSPSRIFSLAVFRRVGNRAEWRVDREGQTLRAPLVGAPAVERSDFAGLERLGVGLHVLLGGPGLFDEERVGGTAHRSKIERQTLQRRGGVAVAVLESDEDFLVARMADLQADAAIGPEVSAGEAHKRAHGEC